MPNFRAAFKRLVIAPTVLSTLGGILCLMVFSIVNMAAAPALAQSENKGQSQAEAATKPEKKSDKNQEKSQEKNQEKSQEKSQKGKKMSAEKNPHVVMETSMGNVEIELFADKAPLSVQNFLQYADDGFYNGTIFHRVISNFMIQGGGFTEKMSQKEPRAKIKNEAKNGLKNDRGTLAMARTNEVDSATAQFFINVKDNDFLNHKNDGDYGYAVFGRVTTGMDVVDKIRAVPTTSKQGYEDVPATPVVIKSMKKK